MPTSVRLPEEAEQRLAALAAKTGRSKAFYIREAILLHLDELESSYLSEQALSRIQRSAGQAKRTGMNAQGHGHDD